ncbi:MAG: hypothetical protein A2190_00405 [Lysobacterales bacterium RIFOXYA1_FULL_69_10]|nr:MAG: hypothetical protein A2190_00405 [Xanthomonadales bacterium RIFOXYA1_FULL_69_10]
MPQTPDLAPIPKGFDAPPPRDLAQDWTTRRVRSRQAWTDAKAANSDPHDDDQPAEPQRAAG